MNNKLKTSILALSIVGALGAGVAVAQSADTPKSVQGESVEPANEVAIPELLKGSEFSDIESRKGPRNMAFIQGTITETGKGFSAIVSDDGKLVGIRTAEGSSLPDSVSASLLPEAVRSYPVTSELVVLSAIGTRGDATMITGQDSSGDKVKAIFNADGKLMKFIRSDGYGIGRDRDDMMMFRFRDGLHDSGSRRGDPKHDKGRDRGKAEQHRSGDRPHNGHNRGDNDDRRGPPPPARSDAASVDDAVFDQNTIRSAVEDAGYTRLGDVHKSADGITVNAVNSRGENVSVVVDPQGEVIREIIR